MQAVDACRWVHAGVVGVVGVGFLTKELAEPIKALGGDDPTIKLGAMESSCPSPQACMAHTSGGKISGHW